MTETVTFEAHLATCSQLIEAYTNMFGNVLQQVLQRKTTVGIITEETARHIHADVGIMLQQTVAEAEKKAGEKMQQEAADRKEAMQSATAMTAPTTKADRKVQLERDYDAYRFSMLPRDDYDR